ncbi:TolB family protein [Paractinoplanes lichenicola]|uniref:PD40 domain-containing protein n=1 Tax=Paractinoplanes lichenicola TaxID=2802976 RepID=A0ABS1VEF6_9ACTN|nr:PD40 domain-containing protein [Actinoplanes lichenicola]MBL7253056.1 PD40 domain-containing protein [Actinoplanes lichenicola]
MTMIRSSRVLVTAVVLGLLTVGTPARATPPGANGRIAYKGYLDAARTTGAIFTVRPGGDGVRQLTRPGPGVVDDQPDWSPDGSLVAFRRCAPDEACAIFTVRSDGSGVRRLSPPCVPGRPCADESEVAFLPDGRRVVFTRSSGAVREFPDGSNWIENSDIVIRDLTGGNARVVLRTAPFSSDNVEVVASPDGRRIAFQRANSPLAEPAGGIAVFVIGADGRHLRRVTPWSLQAGDHPDWSPDGRWLLFRSHVDRDFLDSQLYVVRPDGRDLRQVTHVSPDTMLLSSSFSPDGRSIVYARTGAAGQPDIFTASADGTHVRQVTRTPLWESAPDWGPR